MKELTQKMINLLDEKGIKVKILSHLGEAWDEMSFPWQVYRCALFHVLL